ncbi:hypothetical protein BG015_007769 [Linnemannia schmuckeri]|uniref:TLC domain-containing protein n=1 Tax=Linnemannia schmuckeri TaxID=64567 RepID=A0A9P5S0I6_9FUNG|nr:hypothetical protein BG015_007769 [Linnemannia schmuckeri]
MIPALLQFGYVRLTVYERLGLDAISLGLGNPDSATVFTVWAPQFLSWVQQPPAFSFTPTEESVVGAIAVAYFVGYSAGDLILEYIHYPNQIDPLSGWIHHIVYILLAWRVAMANHLWIFAICGGPLEISTIFLAILFNYPTLSGSAELFAGALCLHVFWTWKYFAGVRRRARRAKKAALGKKLEQGKWKALVSFATTTSSSMGLEGKMIQLRIQKSKK